MPLAALHDARHRDTRKQDRNVAIVPERKQIVVAGDDQISARGERASEHVIIIGIGVDDTRDSKWFD